MILGSLQSTKKIEQLHPLFKEAFDFIRDTDFSSLKDGVIHTGNPRIFSTLVTIQGGKKEDIITESHNKFIEIHSPLRGVEKIGWKATAELMLIATPYNEERDITFFIDQPTSYSKIYPGQFVILFPDDAFAPGIGEGQIRKVIVRLAFEEEQLEEEKAVEA